MSEQIDTVRKCDGANAKYCDVLSDRIELDANVRTKGFVLMVAMNLETGHTRTVGVVFKRNARDGGLFLNLCPFCGEHIDHGFKDKTTGGDE